MRWRVNPGNGTVAGIEADFQPVCHFCHTPLKAVALKLLNFPLNEPDWWERGEKNGHAIDVECWCPNCGYWTTFGVACPKDHWQKIYDRTESIYKAAPRSAVGPVREYPIRA